MNLNFKKANHFNDYIFSQINQNNSIQSKRNNLSDKIKLTLKMKK